MAWFNVFSKQEPSDLAPVLRDREQIIAYLEALFRQGSELLAHLPGDNLEPYSVRLEQISEAKGTFAVRLRSHPVREPGKGMITEFWFNLDGQRFLARAECLGRSSSVRNEFRLPEYLSYADRRMGARMRFGIREKAQVVALESLFEGVGLSGQLLNLGQDGCAFRLEKAIDIQTDRRLALRRDVLSSVTKLGLIRLKEIPNAPVMDLSGVLSHCEARSEGLVVGLSFPTKGGFETQVISRLLLARAPKPCVGFPRKPRQTEQAPPEGGGPETGTAAEVSAVPEAPPAAVEPQRPPKPPIETLSPAETQRLLKRCSRQILVVVENDLEREFLAARLRAEGFRGIHEARGWLPALSKTRKVALDLILMNQQVGPNTALEILESLRSNGLPEQVRVVVLKQQEDVRLTLAAKVGRLVLVPAQPLAFKEVLLPGLEDLLGLSG